MLVFPNSKINIGLNIVKRRVDGFHDLETVFYPIGLSDILEFIETEKKTSLKETGIILNTDFNDNLIIKAYKLIKRHFDIPEAEIHLHKIIPTGAGLGGGSADAAYMLKSLDEYFNLNISDSELEIFAQELGSDCPFFIKNKPVIAQGTGNLFSSINLNLDNYFIIIIKPDIYISTKEAFSGINPSYPKYSIKDVINEHPGEWKDLLVNDFEKIVFKKYTEIKNIKESLYECGAIYSQMSGSGSAVYGLFEKQPILPQNFKKHFIYINKPLL